MEEIIIRLKTIKAVKEFEKAVRDIDCELDIISEGRRYIVDAKSIMGVLSLDLSKNLKMIAYTDDVATLWKIELKLMKIEGVLI